MLGYKYDFEILLKVQTFCFKTSSESLLIFSNYLFKATIFYNLRKATFHHSPNLTKSPDL